jgi:DNA-binding transcriptional ArsR family regulator
VRVTAPSQSELESAAGLFRALAHPLRAQILLTLDRELLSPRELEQRLDGAKLGLVAYHVRMLRDDGLLELVETRRVRGSVESFYGLTPRGRLAHSVLAASCRQISSADPG